MPKYYFGLSTPRNRLNAGPTHAPVLVERFASVPPRRDGVLGFASRYPPHARGRWSSKCRTERASTPFPLHLPASRPQNLAAYQAGPGLYSACSLPFRRAARCRYYELYPLICRVLNLSYGVVSVCSRGVSDKYVVGQVVDSDKYPRNVVCWVYYCAIFGLLSDRC
jgi:hypothetical protein